MEKKYSANGFTLVEMLVVIAIICLLLALIFPIFTSVIENAKRVSCLSNLRNIAVGVFSYGQEYKSYIPVTSYQADDDMRLLYPDYVSEFDVFVCPSTQNYIRKRSDLEFNAPHGGECVGTSYEYWAWCCGARFLSGPFHRRRLCDRYSEVMTILADTDNRVNNLILDPPDNHGIDGGNLLFLDLHAIWKEISEGDTETWWQLQAGKVDAYRHGKTGVMDKP